MGKATTRAIASIGLCDRCISEVGAPVRDYTDRNVNVRHRHRRLGSEVREWHQHVGGYETGHTHDELGPMEMEEAE